jgi:AcrR family transcriptional regulator
MRASGKRPYLSSDRRRDELLGAAASLVVAGGWSALTMKGLAAEARVSRQLVYQHFADLPELLVAVTERLFQATRDATEAVVAQGRDGDVADVARRSFEIYLDLPREQRRVLRAITAEPEIESPELRRVRRHVRDQLVALWTPGVRRRTGLPPTKARALAWTMTSAAWGLGDLVDDDEISLPHARELLARVAGLVLQPAVAQSVRPSSRGITQQRAARRRASATKGSVR